MWRSLALASLVPGCFYVEPVNERPVAAMQVVSSLHPKRGDTLIAMSTSEDPDGDALQLRWLVSMCGPQQGGTASCDQPLPLDPFTAGQDMLSMIIPTQRLDGSLVESLELDLTAIDGHGAVGSLITPMPIEVGDIPPMVTLRASGDHYQNRTSYPIGLPISIFAEKADPDDGAASVTLAWVPQPPSGPLPTGSVWSGGAPDPLDETREKATLTPDQPGLWRVMVTPDDGHTLPQPPPPVSIDLLVDDDLPPCLGAMSPQILDHPITVAGQAHFDVLGVDDDIDAYPTPAPGAKSTITFHWSITPPEGGALVPIATDAAGVLIDSSRYTPGAQVDLRVDIEDAVPRTSPCDDAKPSCSIGANSCLQRQTWHLTMGAP